MLRGSRERTTLATTGLAAAGSAVADEEAADLEAADCQDLETTGGHFMSQTERSDLLVSRTLRPSSVTDILSLSALDEEEEEEPMMIVNY